MSFANSFANATFEILENYTEWGLRGLVLELTKIRNIRNQKRQIFNDTGLKKIPLL